jgi:hypothetical protein
VLELGKSGSHGTAKGTVPVLSGDAVVATLHASNWKEAATAQVGERSWAFHREGGRELTGRWTADPQDVVRLGAHQVSYWKGSWTMELDGTEVEVASTSWWKNTHRFSSGGRQLADSGTTGGWSPRPTLTPRSDLALDHAVFLLWFELVLTRRTAAAAAAV